MSTVNAASSPSLHFGPEWMRAKPASNPPRPAHPPSPPPTTNPPLHASTYSSLLSQPAPHPQEAQDAAHPFRYSRDEMLQIWRDNAHNAELGLEVERWEGVVREDARDPAGAHEMTEEEKRVFALSWNSEVRRRQSHDHGTGLTLSGLGGGARHGSHGPPSPLRERFGALGSRRSRDPDSNQPLTAPHRPSLTITSNAAGPMSPRDAALPSPRPRLDGWMTRRKTANEFGRGGDDALHEQEGEGDSPPEQAKEEPGRDDVGAKESADGSLDESSRESKLDQVVNTALDGPYRDPLLNGNGSGPGVALNGTTGVAARTVGPPGIPEDPETVHWSYKDPTGKVQGPFNGRLMQDWHDKGYFTGSLLMKRTDLDNDWTTVADWENRGGKQFFLVSFSQLPPPGLVHSAPTTDSSSLPQVLSQDSMQREFGIPVQPMRRSTLDSFGAVGSTHSSSPVSSLGGGFSAPSPQPLFEPASAQDNCHLMSARPSRYTGEGRFVEPHVDGSFTTQAGSSVAIPASRKWGQDSSMNSSPSYRDLAASHLPVDVNVPFGSIGPSVASSYSARASSPATSFSQVSSFPAAPRYGAIGSSMLPGENTASFTTVGASGSRNTRDAWGRAVDGGFHDPGARAASYSSSAYGTPPQDSPFNSSVAALSQQALAPLSTAFNQAPYQQSALSPSATQPRSRQVSNSESPWNTPDPLAASTFGQPSLFSGASQEPATTSNEPSTGWSQKHNREVYAKGSGRRDEPSEWYHAAMTTDDSAWGPAVSPEVQASSAAVPVSAEQVAVEELSAPHETVLTNESIPPVTEPTPPPPPPPIPPVAEVAPKKKAAAKPAPAAPPAPAQPPSPVSAQTSQPKGPWAVVSPVGEEGAKKNKQAVAPVSLREIQEAEAKQQTEARKAQQQQKDRPPVARAATEELHTITTSWGLPTSQAGARAGGRAASPATPGGTPASAGAVWSTGPKLPAAKKTMKEIQEEEERNKRTGVKNQEVIASAKRAYAQTATKVSVAQALINLTHFGQPNAPGTSGSAWQTVGPTGKPNPVVANARPPVSTTPSTSVVPATRTANGAQARAQTAQHVKQPSQSSRSDEAFVPPSKEFMTWLREALKDLTTVNLDEFMRLLLTFPVDPKDPSVIETIADQVYMYSSTMDGRRFAAEFCERRKADATSKRAASVTNPAAKQSVLAEVVRTQAKGPATSSEWQPATKKRGKAGK